MGLGLGLATWCLLTRVVQLGQLRSWPYEVLVALSMFVLAALGARHLRRPRAMPEEVASRDSFAVPTGSDPLSGGPCPNCDSRVRDRLAACFLASRELEVACAYAMGMPSAKVAARLGIKPATVRATIQRVYRKVHVANRSEFLEQLGSPARDVLLAQEQRRGEGFSGVAVHDLPTDRRVVVTIPCERVRVTSAAGLCAVALLCVGTLPIGLTVTRWGTAPRGASPRTGTRRQPRARPSRRRGSASRRSRAAARSGPWRQPVLCTCGPAARASPCSLRPA